MIAFSLFMVGATYWLGKRKTRMPITVAIIGLITSIMPPIALMYLVILVFRAPVDLTSDPKSQR